MAILRPTLTPKQDKQRAAAIRQSQIESNAGINSGIAKPLIGARPGVITKSGNTLFKDGKLIGNYNSPEAANAAYAEFTGTGSNVAGDTSGKTYRYIQQYGVGDKANPSTPYYGQFQSPTASPARTPFKVNALNAGVSGNQMQGNPYDTSGGSYNPGAFGASQGVNQGALSTTDSSYLSTAPEKPKTLAEIRADQLAQAQSSIDATQAVFEDTLRSIRQTGASQLAQTSSNNVSAGLAGSPFAQTNEAGVQNYTQEQLNARANQRAADISSIRQAAEANAQNIYQQGIQNYQADRSFYVSERDKQLEAQKALADADKKSATDTLSTLAKSGYSIDEMKPEEYKALLAKAGMSDFEARAIWAASSPKANAKYEIKNGFIVGTYFDPHTGLPVVTTTALPDALKDKKDVKLNTQVIGGKLYAYDENDPKYDDKGNLILVKAVADGVQVEDTEPDKVLSPSEAAALGVPYGTTASEAALLAGTMLTDKQQKDIEGSTEAKQLLAIKDLNNKLASYKTEVNQAGGFDSVGSRKAILDSLYADLQVAYKEAANLGAITGPDLGLIQAAIKPASGITNYPSYLLGGGQEGLNASIDTALSTIGSKARVFSDSLLSKYPGYENDPYIQNLIGNNASKNNATSIQFDKSYGDINSVVQDYPELQSQVDAMRQSGASDDEILQAFDGMYGAGSTSFKSDVSTSLNSSPNASKIQSLASAYTPGSTGGQCGNFVNQHTGFNVGDSYASKMAITDPSIGKKNNPPKSGDVFVFPYKNTGHIGFIASVQPLSDGTYKLGVLDSNYHLDEKVDMHYINSKIVTGYARPKEITA